MNEKRFSEVNENMDYSDRVLEFTPDGEIYMHYGDQGESHRQLLEDYLLLSSTEKAVVKVYKNNGYTLVWERETGSEYPDYLKYFFIHQDGRLLDGEEKTHYRVPNTDIDNHHLKQLIFVKLKSQEVEKTKEKFHMTLAQILGTIFKD